MLDWAQPFVCADACQHTAVLCDGSLLPFLFGSALFAVVQWQRWYNPKYWSLPFKMLVLFVLNYPSVVDSQYSVVRTVGKPEPK